MNPIRPKVYGDTLSSCSRARRSPLGIVLLSCRSACRGNCPRVWRAINECTLNDTDMLIDTSGYCTDASLLPVRGDSASHNRRTARSPLAHPPTPQRSPLSLLLPLHT
jgi:hypothetical protein